MPTTEFTASEAKARFSELLARAQAGEVITIRKHGRAVAMLSPTRRPAITADERVKAWEDWFAYRKAHKITLGPDLTIADLLADTRAR